jgi:transaldolase
VAKRYVTELGDRAHLESDDFDHAIKNSTAYDAAIREKLSKGKTGEALFFELALEDITRAADLFRPIYDQTDGVDGWVSLEVSPLLAHDTASTLDAAKDLHARAGRPNLFIKIPGTQEGLPAIEEAIFAGIRSTSRFCSLVSSTWPLPRFPARHRAAIDAGLKLVVGSVARYLSVADSAVMGRCPRPRASLASPSPSVRIRLTVRCLPRWQRFSTRGPQRLLWASTGTKDPKASDVLYVKALAAPFTVNTMPEGTLKALADHGELGTILPVHGGDCEEVLAQFAKAGIDIDALAAQLQDEGAKSLPSRNELMAVIQQRALLTRQRL